MVWQSHNSSDSSYFLHEKTSIMVILLIPDYSTSQTIFEYLYKKGTNCVYS